MGCSHGQRDTHAHRAHRHVRCVAFAPDGKTLASGSADDTVKLWHVATGKEIRTLFGHTEPVELVAFAPNGKTLASGSRDGSLNSGT